MNYKIFHQHRILAQYVYMKLNNRISDLKMEDLNEFFNEKGWYMYDMDQMIQNIQTWRNHKKISKITLQPKNKVTT